MILLLLMQSAFVIITKLTLPETSFCNEMLRNNYGRGGISDAFSVVYPYRDPPTINAPEQYVRGSGCSQQHSLQGRP